MTALDDGLNTNTPLFAPATIKAEWKELPPDYASGVTQDSIQQLGEQIGPQGFSVSQSLDDGLPDPVSMTGGNDASGTLSSDLVGRPGLDATAASIANGWTIGSSVGNGTGTLVVPTYPGFMEPLDYHLVAIMADQDLAIRETGIPDDSAGSWTVLGDVVDGVTTKYRTWLFGRQHSAGQPVPSFTLTSSANWSYATTALRTPKTMSGAIVPVTAGRPEYSPETSVSAITTHTTPTVKITGRGWTFGVFGTGAGAGPWTAGAGSTGIAQSVGGAQALLITRSNFIPGPLSGMTLKADTTLSTTVAAMMHVPLEIRERPMMDAAAYFSPFNSKSPIYGYERDTAAVTASANVITPVGSVATNIFTGIMADIGVAQRTASLDAVSRTRIKLDTSVTVPTVNGPREGATTDWLASFLMAQGGQYVGPAPTRNTRFWAPLHGSLHPHMDGPVSYPTSVVHTTSRSPTGPYKNTEVNAVDGPYLAGMYAQQSNDTVVTNLLSLDPNWETKPPGIDDPLTYDLLSKNNGRGRLSFYIRADAATAAPAALAGANDFLFRFTIYNLTPTGSAGNYIQFVIRGDRKYDHTLGNTSSAVGGLTLPSDGNWYFMGFAWDYVAATTMGKRDGTNWNTNSHSSTLSELPNSTADLYARGLSTNCLIESRLPISEVCLCFGPEVYTGLGSTTWLNWRTTPKAPGLNATYRPTRQPLAAIAEPAPVAPWGKLQEIAKSTLSAMRLNEEDNFEFLPLDYFGETAQMTVATANILDTSINAADLDVKADPSKTRNIVTSQYQEVRASTSLSSILEVTSLVTIPRGETFQTFALDVQAVEVHGAAFWQSATPEITKLTSAQIAAGTIPANTHVMTVNLIADGTGTVVAASVVQARIVSWDNSTVTIRFRNNWPGNVFLSNNGSGVPVLRILGYAISRNDAYTGIRDLGSLGVRRERALTTDMPWIQDRSTAVDVTTKLVSILARPRPQITVSVMGDPRRRPGMLTTLTDASGTQAVGTWRILKVDHQISGAMYVQDLDLVRVADVGVWDQSFWDNAVWGV